MPTTHSANNHHGSLVDQFGAISGNLDKIQKNYYIFREAFPNTKYGLVIIKGTSLPPMKISFAVASLLQSWPYAARRAKACSTNDH